LIKKVAFVGIGVMGFPMAKHLIEAGYDLTVHNRHPEKCRELLNMGAKLAPSAAEVARDVDIVFTMLPTEHTVREVVLGEGGVASGARPGTIFCNTSTVSPASNISLGEELEKRGFRFLDSPVTGSGLQAKDGTLVFIVGGDKDLFDLVLPLYKAMGKGAYHASPKIGAGAYAKLCSNAMMAINMLSFSEAVTMAAKLGVDPEMFVKFCNGGGPQSAMADKKVGKIINRDFSAAFRTALMYKDTVLASELAREIKIPTPMLNLAKEMFNIACIEGHADEDMCSVVQCYEKWADVQVKK